MQIPATSVEIYSQLQVTFSKEEILEKLRSQLLWDFERAHCSIVLTTSLEPESMSLQLEQALTNCSPLQIKQLLYLIDLPEVLHVQILGDSNYFQQLANLILYREFVKIYYKLSYSTT